MCQCALWTTGSSALSCQYFCANIFQDERLLDILYLYQEHAVIDTESCGISE